MANMKQTNHCSFGHVWSSYPRLTSEARSLFAKCHLAVHPPRQVKLYLIKMLCSLPNSSPHIWFPLFMFCGWARTSTPLNQSLLKRENIWVTFLHLVWYDKAAAAPVRTGWELGEGESYWSSTQLCCHSPLLLQPALEHLNHFFTFRLKLTQLPTCIIKNCISISLLTCYWNTGSKL